jgi:hypothetical protein
MAAALLALLPQRAFAIPLFAQRYHLRCAQCHSVLPELNTFGNYFRDHGYRLPLPKHGTTGIALRYQLEWEENPAAGTRRFSPAGVLLSNADIGAITAFIHYNFGAGGGPAGLYLGYLATYDQHTDSLYRAGLFELPLAQSPGQRLDDLAPYGYYGTHVGLNNLALSSPRWGFQAERNVGDWRADLTIAFDDYNGSAYGGKPVATGETTSQSAPELGLFVRDAVTANVDAGGEVLTGARSIALVGRPNFTDAYDRYGVYAHAQFDNLDLQAEQWWGRDSDADGLGDAVGSSGGYVRLKYYPIDHAYIGVRYDAAAAPFVSRDLVYYGAVQIFDARLLVQDVHPLGGAPSHLGAALTVGFPPPLKL